MENIARSLFWTIGFTLMFAAFCTSSPLTFELGPLEEECFYQTIAEPDCTILYYFTVQQSYTNKFELDYKVFGPNGESKPLIERSRVKQEEWQFRVHNKGEYAICFKEISNSNKFIDMEFEHRCENAQTTAELEQTQKPVKNSIYITEGYSIQEMLKGSIDRMERQFNVLKHTLQYYKTRNNRNYHTVQSILSSVVKFSMYGIWIILLMAFAQIIIIQWIFNRSQVIKS
ncbi:HBR186Wp [Eremothecium sinecaudum]|uniref:HBR186Wp n=1 Tax=Eremothecium sinecaudum TaxID=45286 RepID=A0A109UXS2_9SACH|nr:HBR186Wp [Eremothecium sinecaudum]AMD19087.1 HBR186Wp [Eremothecium sinecaudum]